MSTIEFNDRLISLMAKLELFAFRLTSNRDDAKDLMQETLYKALSNKEKFQPQSNFRAWIYTIMKNTFINDYRRLKRQQSLVKPSREDKEVTFEVRSVLPYPDSDYRCSEIESMISGLDDSHRIPFQKYNSGFKYEEIACELELPLGTVKSRIFLARKRLMEKLK